MHSTGAFGDYLSTKQLAKTNDDLSKSEEGAVKVRETAIALLGKVKKRVDELSQGSTFLTATLNSIHGRRLQGRDLVFLRAGEYYKIIEYINPDRNATTDAMLDIAYFHQAPLADDITEWPHHALFPLFNLKQEVVWGFKDPKEALSNN
jgi:hypothetical protein